MRVIPKVEVIKISLNIWGQKFETLTAKIYV